MAPQPVDTPRERGHNGNQVLDELLFQRAIGFLVDDLNVRAVTVKIRFQVFKPEPREAIRVCEEDLGDPVLLTEGTEFAEPDPPGIETTTDIGKGVGGD